MVEEVDVVEDLVEEEEEEEVDVDVEEDVEMEFFLTINMGTRVPSLEMANFCSTQ